MDKTNFEKVIEFNDTFNVHSNRNPQHAIFDDNPSVVKLRMDLIREEVAELEEAVRNKDMKETADALADILYVVYGAGLSFGIDMDMAFKLVHESNMSKICHTETVAIATVEWYMEKYESGELPYDTPSYREIPNTGKYVLYNQSTGKILKSLLYHPVEFGSILS